MDQNNQPITQQPGPVVTPQGEKKVGPIVATLIIVLILIIAALYLFASKINQPDTAAENSLAAGVQASDTTMSQEDVQSLQDDLDSATTGLDQQNF